MRQKSEVVEQFKSKARLELRKHMRQWEYGEKDSLARLGLFPSQAREIMCDEPTVSLERLIEALSRAGIEFRLELI